MATNPAIQGSKPPVLICRGYRPGDENQIATLMMPQWEHIKDVGDWTHEFTDSPDGPCVCRVCEIDGRIVGHNGLIPMQMTVGDKTVLGGKVEGSVVSEEYRGAAGRLAQLPAKDRPIHLNLSRQLWKEAIAQNVAIMFGFPNRKALYGHLKAGWEPWVLQEQRLVRPISAVRSARLLSNKASGSHCPPMVASVLAVPLWLVARCVRPLGCHRHASVIPVNEFDDRIDCFWGSLAERHQMVSIRRTSCHLNWRFAHAPYVRAVLVSNGELRGYGIAVTRNREEFAELEIVDLVMDDRFFDCLGQILRSLMQQAGSKTDVVTISCYLNGCAYAVRLNSELKKYFLPASRVRSRVAILRVDPLRCDETTIRNPTNWFVNSVFSEMF